MGGGLQIQSYCQEFGVSLSWAKGRRLEYFESELSKVGDEVVRLISLKERWCGEFERALIESLIKDRLKEHRKLEGRASSLKYGNRPGSITDEMIQRAKEYPIQEILGTDRKTMRCPFHDDKHPSASIKNNRLHCFVCNKTWNPVDYLMEKEMLSFKEAVVMLN